MRLMGTGVTSMRLWLMGTGRYLHEAHGYRGYRHESFSHGYEGTDIRLIGTESTAMRLLLMGTFMRLMGYRGYRHEVFYSWVRGYRHEAFCSWVPVGYLHEAHGYRGYRGYRHESFSHGYEGTDMRLIGTESTAVRLLLMGTRVPT
ncbi:hypothetical protein M0R45_020782 [Rubus argutus]|uniref:Uncharacterized protein n=1 Tax=Rubus argutus TaxID=59490 RepID=A0AAW1XBJ3_RUBAR